MEVDEREEFASVSNEPVAGPSNQVAGGPSTGDAPFPTKNAGVNQGAGKAGGGKKANHHKGEGRTRKKGKGSRGDDEEEERQLTIEEKLAISPYDYELHVQNIKNAATYEEREQGRIFMSQMIALLEQDWLEWIKDKKSHEGASLESKVEILELYKRACADLLSIEIHTSYANYILELYFTARGYTYPAILLEEQEQPADVAPALDDVDGSAAVFDENFVEGEMSVAVGNNIRWHLTEGQSIWKILHAYQVFIVRASPTSQAIEKLEAFYRQRLSEPHLQLADTHQLFSEFVSRYRSDAYESILVETQAILKNTNALIEPREAMEDELANSKASREAFEHYLDWEQEVKKPNLPLLLSLLSRAIALHPDAPAFWQQMVSIYARSIERPNTYTLTESQPIDPDGLAQLCHRMSRFCPFDGELLSTSIRKLESLAPFEVTLNFAQAQFERTLEGEDNRLHLEAFVQLATSYADVLRHAEMNDANDGPTEAVVTLLKEAISRVKSLTRGAGDPQLRLERYLLRQYERAGDLEAMGAFWSSLSSMYPLSAVVLVTRAEHLQRNNEIDAARKLYATCGKKRLDYPEYVFEAWIGFEHRDGTLATLQKAIDTITHEMVFVQRRRSKVTQLEQSNFNSQAYPEAQFEETTGAIEKESTTQPPLKRTAEEELLMTPDSQEAASKRTKQEADDANELKRDRENSTVAVTGLALDIDESALLKLFKDCGQVRDVKVRKLDDQAVATVEFISREQVPAALTKDKKRVNGTEINVAPVWQTTLYVANFPESSDAADIQKMFEPFGHIFETRWPSRRFKSTRRFVYIQYVDPAAAHRALALHNTETAPGSGHHLQVLISNPSRRQTRTDANANKRELYITGLPRQTTEDDLTKLFISFGALKSCRVLRDETGACKGVAFVDFDTEQSASAALSMNNHEYKKRRLAVVLADSKLTQRNKLTASGQGTRTDIGNRSIRAIGLPPQAQEPLVQQLFDRYGRTTSVNIHGNVATVTFENPADAAQLLLSNEPVIYDGITLALKEHVPGHRRAKGDEPGNAKSQADTVATFLPRAGRGRGKKLGIGAARTISRTTMEGENPPDQASTSRQNHNDLSKSMPTERKQDDFRAMLLG